MIGQLRARIPDAVIERWYTTSHSRRRCTKRTRRIHPAVHRAIAHLCEGLEHGDISLHRLSRIAGLSPSRFMHVFTESIGIPLRPYLLWLRMQCGIEALVAGRTITEAAHIAGFADASHLTRTMRRALGLTPTELVFRIGALPLESLGALGPSGIIDVAKCPQLAITTPRGLPPS